MFKVRTHNQIALEGLERFPRDRFEVGTELADPEGILLRSHVLTPEAATPPAPRRGPGRRGGEQHPRGGLHGARHRGL